MKKMFRKILKITSLALVALCLKSCHTAAELPVGVKYDIVAVGDYKTSETSRPDILFTEEGTFHGTTGCNRYFGEYTVDGADIKIAENMGMTRMFCVEVDAQERILSEVLPKISDFSIKGDQLILGTANGQKITCTKSAEQPSAPVQEEPKSEPATAVEKAFKAEETK